MIKTTYTQETFTVGELIEELKKFPLDMPIADDGFNEVTSVSIRTCMDSNYPWNRPDQDYVVIL